ncbi:MAG: hypothetical protein JW820_17320 [Spirochaetales bacterium]|nr:hypothetical protein [Spirochaetales bacterium]
MNQIVLRLALFAGVLCLAAVGQLAAKAGALRAAAGDILNPLLALSLCCLFARGLLWLAVLRRERLVFAYPIMALAYPLVLVLARLAFGEPITVGKAAGSLLIVAGVGLAAVSEARL